jgi:hypothetical protein
MAGRAEKLREAERVLNDDRRLRAAGAGDETAPHARP